MDWGLILGCGAVVALIESAKELILWRKNRKAQLEDNSAEKKTDQDRILEEQTKNIGEIAGQLMEYMESNDSRNKEILSMLSSIKVEVETINEKQDKQCEALRESLHNSIVHIAKKYIDAGEIPVDEYVTLKRLADAHHAIDGNGATKDVMETLHSIIK